MAVESAAASDAVLRALRGEEPRLPPDLDDSGALRALEEKADAGDRDARRALALRAHLLAVPALAARALERERAHVVLADGSSLSLDDAERLLARKEERRAHAPLRASIDDALAPFRRFDLRRTELPAAVRERLQAFLASSRPLLEAARDALATLGGEPLEGQASLARALDLPDDDGAFGEPHTLALLAAAREAAKPDHRVGRTRVPRAWTGIVLRPAREESGAGEARFGFPPLLLRADRHLRVLDAAARALAPPSTSDVIGPALALGLSSTTLRRTTGVSRATAERGARISAATTILLVRARVALALVEEPHLDAAREALISAWGGDPGAALTREHATRPPTLLDDDDVVADLLTHLDAARLALVARDTWDEVFPLRREAWRALADAAPPGGRQDSPPPVDDATAWAGWLGGLL